VSGGQTINGVDSNVFYGILGFDSNNQTIQNNIIQNMAGQGFVAFTGGTAKTGNQIVNNRFDNIPGGTTGSSPGRGISLLNDYYANVSNNVMTNVRIGIQTNNFGKAGSPASITNNTITATFTGIWHNLHYPSATPFTIANNNITITTSSGTTPPSTGIYLTSITNGDINVTNNATSGGDVGVRLWNVPGINVNLNGGSISNTGTGIVFSDNDPSFNAAQTGNQNLNVDNVTISGTNTAIEVNITVDDGVDRDLSVNGQNLNINNSNTGVVVNNSTTGPSSTNATVQNSTFTDVTTPSAGSAVGTLNLLSVAFVTSPPSNPDSGPRAPEISPITYTGDLQSTTSFQLIDGTRVSYNGTTGIIIVVFPNGSSRTVGFPGRITDNQDGTLNVFDETGDAFVDRVIITGRGGEIVTSAPQQTTNTGGAQVRDVTGCTVTTQNIMNLRAEPSVSSADLDDVAFATPLGVSQVATVAGDPNSPWYRVTYNGQTGWVAGPFVETSGTC